MTWQDIVLTIAIILFSYALIPQVYEGFKKKKGLVNLQTSSITAAGMYAVSIVYFTLNLYFSTIIGIINAVLWTLLFIQKLIYKS